MIFLKYTKVRIKPRIIISLGKSVLFMLIGHWLGCILRKNNDDAHSISAQNQVSSEITSKSEVSNLKYIPKISDYSSWHRSASLITILPSVFEAVTQVQAINEIINLINIGFVTDGKNIVNIDECLKTLFLYRQSIDFLAFHILAPKSYWSSIDEKLLPWRKIDNGLMYSFNYTFYDTAECTELIEIFQTYFDNVYNIAFCKLIFPYLLDPFVVPYIIIVDMDILVLSHHFTSKCWLETIQKLNQNPFALFSIAHQGSPLTKRLPFPMPYVKEAKAHFHFNNGIIVFHVARIHALDKIKRENTSLSDAYPVSAGPKRWLRDLQRITLGYLQGCRVKHSLTQVLWNVYMAYRTDSFVHLNQACNFQPCAQHTYVQMWDNYNHFPNIIIGHIWRVCMKRKTAESSYFASYYQALAYLPISYVNRINPTRLVM